MPQHKDNSFSSEGLRDLFLKFFVEKGSQILPSSPLVPKGDPTLLFTTAGMVQLKPFFLGQVAPPARRLTSVQKCFRTTDIDCVGDSKHLTFFEMLGNFSVGDYFKKEAIAFAWEFVTERLKLPRERLWTTVFLDDDDAAKMWGELGVPAGRIVRLGEKENFWGPAGDSGPCGPCSEIHYDFGEHVGCCRKECNPSCDCGRFVEVWNLVFMQFNQDKQGKRTPLPKPNIDTGMGLERITAVMQGKSTVYETDIFSGLLKKVAEISGKTYAKDEATDRAMRIVAEHSRGIAFLIADGVTPGNEGRGYVLRRLLRRASIFGRKLGMEKPFLSATIGSVESSLSHVYPELAKNRELITQVVTLEEERFQATLAAGLENLNSIMAKGGREKVIPGQVAFSLYDTYGFPVELTTEIAAENGFSVDMAVFEQEMERQRQRGRESSRFGGGEADLADYSKLGIKPTEFVGYEGTSSDAIVVAMSSEGNVARTVTEGRKIEVILDRTSFYGEMGGQVGDKGRIVSGKTIIDIEETVWLAGGIVGHRGRVASGSLSVGDRVTASVDSERRADIARNHTATHLVQAALRKVLGEHVQQRGSLVAPERMRFDFSHLKAVEPSELAEIQSFVNDAIRRNLSVKTEVMPYTQAVAKGAIALFGEKYGETVRLVQVSGHHCGTDGTAAASPVSAELCGGTHTRASGDIGLFLITTETSVGAGLRRIEGVTGRAAEQLVGSYAGIVQSVSGLVKASPDEVAQKITGMLKESDEARKRISQLERELSRKGADSLVSGAISVDGVSVLAAKVTASSANALREAGDALRDKLKSGVIVLGAAVEERPQFLVIVTPDMVKKGLNAGDIAKKVAQVAGGGGGGRPEMAMAGGKDTGKLDAAIAEVVSIVEKVVKK